MEKKLVNTKRMFEDAIKGNYAIRAFNFSNMEMCQGIVKAADEEGKDIILAVSAGAVRYAGVNYIKGIVDAAVMESTVNLALHLDHGDSVEICKECIDAGFTSVMFDGSHLPFEENIRLTKEVVAYAHPRNVSVEAELGILAGIEDDIEHAETVYTNPEDAIKFISETNCDSLAIAIGTSHGPNKFEGIPKLRFDILEDIRKELPDYPIVLHGTSSIDEADIKTINANSGCINNEDECLRDASGVSNELIKRAIELNVCKLNYATDIKLAMTAGIREYLNNNPKEIDPRVYIDAGTKLVTKRVQATLKSIS